MFPLKKNTKIRGCREHIKAGLGCAIDLVADKDDLFAPFNGSIRSFYGKEGGNWLELTRENGERIRFAHLSTYIKKTGKVKEGEKIAITGNTGSITTGPHLHLECYDTAGKRLDPESYLWDNSDSMDDQEKAAYEKTIRELNTEIGDVTKERDKLREENESLRKDNKRFYSSWQKCLDDREPWAINWLRNKLGL